MIQESYWHRRSTEVMLKAAEAKDQRLREIYLELAAHYVSMARMCVTGAPTRPKPTPQPKPPFATHQPVAN